MKAKLSKFDDSLCKMCICCYRQGLKGFRHCTVCGAKCDLPRSSLAMTLAREQNGNRSVVFVLGFDGKTYGSYLWQNLFDPKDVL